LQAANPADTRVAVPVYEAPKTCGNIFVVIETNEPQIVSQAMDELTSQRKVVIKPSEWPISRFWVSC
jgi:hypothetical protein